MTDDFVSKLTEFPTDSSDSWLSYVLCDPALLHVALAMSSAYHTLLTEDSPADLPVEYYYHKGAAIKLINKGLSRFERDHNDGLVAAVACLAALENLNGSIETSALHIIGLGRMVSIRGGLQTLGMKGLLKRLVIWADLSHSSVSLAKPRFIDSESSLEQSLQIHSQDLIEAPLPASQQPNCTPVFINAYMKAIDGSQPGLMQILNDLRTLSSQKCGNPNAQESHIKSFNDRIHIAELRINTVLHQEIASGHMNGYEGFIHAAFPITAAIFIYAILREVPILSKAYDTFVRRAKERLDGLQLSFIEAAPLRVLVWVLFMAGVASKGRPERLWFRAQLEAFCTALRLDAWDKAKTVVDSVVRIGSGFERDFKRLWDEFS